MSDCNSAALAAVKDAADAVRAAKARHGRAVDTLERAGAEEKAAMRALETAERDLDIAVAELAYGDIGQDG